jgi:hypothetical protein
MLCIKTEAWGITAPFPHRPHAGVALYAPCWAVGVSPRRAVVLSVLSERAGCLRLFTFHAARKRTEHRIIHNYPRQVKFRASAQPFSQFLHQGCVLLGICMAYLTLVIDDDLHKL